MNTYDKKSSWYILPLDFFKNPQIFILGRSVFSIICSPNFYYELTEVACKVYINKSEIYINESSPDKIKKNKWHVYTYERYKRNLDKFTEIIEVWRFLLVRNKK